MAGTSIELVERLLDRRCTVERPITVDQTNISVVVDEAIVVKWLQPPVPSPHPGVGLIRHLTSAGFDDMPQLLGVEERDGVVHAIVTAYLPGALDGWDWYVDDVVAWLDGALPFDALLSSARRMSDITARLHHALADLQPARIDLSAVAGRAMADLRLAHDRLDGVEWLSPGTVDAALEPLRRATTANAHRIHGDLHAGQFLRAGATMLVTDFDGNPLQDVLGRGLPQSPLRDLASLLQSIVHVGSIVVKRHRPGRLGDVGRFAELAAAAALESYRAAHDVDDELLRAFRVAQELHEYAYSIEHLPHWRYVADDALPDLLGLPRPRVSGAQ